ncbi:hypothetical protein ACV34R_27110, partial [Pseudomonas aeruginosa]
MQPTSPTRKPRASSQARIAAILDAARGLLANEGIGGLTIYSVAERAEGGVDLAGQPLEQGRHAGEEVVDRRWWHFRAFGHA